MRVLIAALAGLAACFALSALSPGCTSERLVLELVVRADPNPATGAPEPGGKRWDYQVSIINPTAAAVTVKFYHAALDDTDSGYEQQLQPVRDSSIVGLRIDAGARLDYPANRSSEGRFARGRERRVYHAQGDDGKYYSGEVVIGLE